MTIKCCQCIIYPICPCLRPKSNENKIQNKSPTKSKSSNKYAINIDNQQPIDQDEKYENELESEEQEESVSLRIGHFISKSSSPSKHKRKSRIEKSKLNADIFSDTQDVEKRLDIEILGDHDSSDSEIKTYVEKQTRGNRMRRRL